MKKGALPENIRTMMQKNTGELSNVEGNMLTAGIDRELRTVLITSSNPFEGKTISSICIAYSLAYEAKARVLLIDGNLRFPKLHQIFNIGEAPGLTDFILHDNNKVLRETDYKNLMIMPYGTKVANPFDVYKAILYRDKLDTLRQKFDYIIFDAPSLLTSTETSVVAKRFDGIILVVECEKTRWEVVQQAKEKIDKVGGYILGVILNRRRYYIPRGLYGKI